METKIVKLHFKSPVHFGDGRLDGGRSTCDAGTLFSALFIEALKMGLADELLDAARDGRLLLSDAFPYIGKDYYLPKPMVALPMQDDNLESIVERGDSRAKKAFKKLQFIGSERFADFLSGRLDPLAELERFQLGVASLQVKVNLERQRSDDAEPYGVGVFSFFDGAGIYFVVQGTYDITPIIEQLQFSGVGGKRTSGYGRFSYEVAEVPAFFDCVGSSGECAVGLGKKLLLSSAAPAEDELTYDLLQGAMYRLERKGGFVQSARHSATPQKKRDFYVFASGSVFERAFEGDVFDVNVTEGAHPVYRYARALWMEV